MAHSKLSLQSIMESNQVILDSYYTFKTGSPLKIYLQTKVPALREIYKLKDVLTLLKNIIRDEGMFDHLNPAIIMCSPQLEAALNMKALHVSEIRSLVLNHLIKKCEKCQAILRTAASWSWSTMMGNPTQELLPLTPCIPTTSVTHSVIPATVFKSTPAELTADNTPEIYRLKSSRFELMPMFRDVLANLPDFEDKPLYGYNEVALLLSRYILSRKEEIFDPRNIKIALVTNDPLGETFGVNAFHRSQVTQFMRNQMVPVTPVEVATSSLMKYNLSFNKNYNICRVDKNTKIPPPTDDTSSTSTTEEEDN
jgi:hypothetical protein